MFSLVKSERGWSLSAHMDFRFLWVISDEWWASKKKKKSIEMALRLSSFISFHFGSAATSSVRAPSLHIHSTYRLIVLADPFRLWHIRLMIFTWGDWFHYCSEGLAGLCSSSFCWLMWSGLSVRKVTASGSKMVHCCFYPSAIHSQLPSVLGPLS